MLKTFIGRLSGVSVRLGQLQLLAISSLAVHCEESYIAAELPLAFRWAVIFHDWLSVPLAQRDFFLLAVAFNAVRL